MKIRTYIVLKMWLEKWKEQMTTRFEVWWFLNQNLWQWKSCFLDWEGIPVLCFCKNIFLFFEGKLRNLSFWIQCIKWAVCNLLFVFVIPRNFPRNYYLRSSQKSWDNLGGRKSKKKLVKIFWENWNGKERPWFITQKW